MWRTDPLEKDPGAGKGWRQEEKGTTEDKMVGWHHQLDGHAIEQAPGVGDGQGSLACCSPWGHKELDTTEQTKLADHSIIKCFNWWRHSGRVHLPLPNTFSIFLCIFCAPDGWSLQTGSLACWPQTGFHHWETGRSLKVRVYSVPSLLQYIFAVAMPPQL